MLWDSWGSKDVPFLLAKHSINGKRQSTGVRLTLFLCKLIVSFLPAIDGR